MRTSGAGTLLNFLKKAAGLALAMAVLAILCAAAPSPESAAPTESAPGASPSRSVAPSSTPTSAVSAKEAQVRPLPDQAAIIRFLGEIIGWYRHLAVEDALVSDPTEMLFVTTDKQMANQVLDLSFEFARAAAEVVGNTSELQSTIGAPGHPATDLADLEGLAAKAAQVDAQVKTEQEQTKALQARLSHASRAQRAALAAQITAAQSALELAQARSDAMHSMLQFRGGSLRAVAGNAVSLANQIDELDKSVTEAERNPKSAAPAPARPVQPGGITGIAGQLIALNSKLAAIDDMVARTSAVAQSVQQMREPFYAELRDLNLRGQALASAPPGGDVAALRERKAAFEGLIGRYKLAAAAAIPLAKENVVLNQYAANLERWHTAVRRESSQQLRNLTLRLSVLGTLLAVIFAAATLWRRFTFRYVKDRHRRHQLLQARRIVLALVVLLVLLLNFTNEFGALATVMGFAAAGIAFALQNVILSVAGYFFLIGRFGIKVGDRVQVAGVSGDVIDIGLVKLSLMELGGNGSDRQPTGRMVVFSNAVVFQPSGNFFKQIPETDFVWNEVSLMLAPDCDYRLAEKRLLEAVDEVFARYRETIQRQYISAARSLNVVLDSPKPQSRLQLSESGLTVSIRYPAETRNAVQTADEVSRRLLDAIAREPTLKLVGQGIPNIQLAPPAPVGGDGTR